MAFKKATDVVAYMEDVNAKLPMLPVNARDVLVKVAPWISLIFGILGILISLAGIGVLAVFAPLAMVYGGAHYGSGLIVSLLFLVSSVLMLASFPGLRKHRYSGWNLLFWSEVVSLVSAVISVSIEGVIFALLGFYLLFQIKSYYK